MAYASIEEIGDGTETDNGRSRPVISEINSLRSEIERLGNKVQMLKSTIEPYLGPHENPEKSVPQKGKGSDKDNRAEVEVIVGSLRALLDEISDEVISLDDRFRG